MVSSVLDSLPKVKGEYRGNFGLAQNTWFNVGGKAEVLYKPFDINDLSFFLKNKPKNINVTILGACSNVIIRDGGIKGVVIKLGRAFTGIDINGDLVEIGCAALDFNVASFLLDKELSGLEFLIGIPGVIGGAIAMNAGCYGQEISESLIAVEAVNINNGDICKFSKNDLGFAYRTNQLSKDWVFVKALFKLQKDRQENIKARMDDIVKQRESTQPVRVKTGGSTFKNPNNCEYKAWQLIDKAGLRGYQVGDAQISEKHCNFMLNLGNATARDLESLGELVIDRVYKDSGIMLEWEIKRIGY